MSRKKAVLLLVVGIIIFFVVRTVTRDEPLPTAVIEETPEVVESGTPTVIGNSVEGREIVAYTFGSGDTHLLFVGGVHGGYEWNSVYLAHEFIDYFTENPDAIPASLKVSVIPSANPDGLFAVIKKEGRFELSDTPTTPNTLGTGRFNANNVDLNRNFDCKWEPTSTWRSKTVSAGDAPFSEPEAVAIRDFVLTHNPRAVIFWHSQANAVYASECHEGVLPETLAIMNAYADASGYKPVATFDAYPVTGDAEGWLASINIPALTVELKSHETIEWQENLAGVKSMFSYYLNKN